MNHIEAAVLPLKSEAIARAATDARELVGRVLSKIIEHGNDRRAAFPDPNSRTDGRNEYLAKRNRRDFASRITKLDPSKPADYRMSAPVYVIANAEGIDKVVADAQQMAATQYDLFVAKLTKKVGEGVVGATLSGNHVWGRSTLTVTKADGSVERWMTQQIVNQSVLGTLFNQWPTRKVK